MESGEEKEPAGEFLELAASRFRGIVASGIWFRRPCSVTRGAGVGAFLDVFMQSVSEYCLLQVLEEPYSAVLSLTVRQLHLL